MKVSAKTVGTYLVVALVVFWVFFPIGWMFNMTLQTEAEIHTRPPNLLPPNPTTFNYYFIFNVEEAMKARLQELGTFFLPAIAKEIFVAIRNSLTIAFTMVGINVVAATLAAHAFARVRFRGSWPLFLFCIASRLIPPVAVLVPFYIIIRSLGMLDSVFALIMIYSAYTLPISVWIMHGYLQALPPDIEDAARVDGYSRLETIFNTVFPVMAPGIVAIGIYSFMLAYIEFFFAFILTETAASHTIPVIVAAIGANPVSPKGILMATGVITMLPPVIVIIVFRRFMIRGLVAATIK